MTTKKASGAIVKLVGLQSLRAGNQMFKLIAVALLTFSAFTLLGKIEPEIVEVTKFEYIYVKEDMCAADNIGLKKLTINDIEGLIN